MLSFRGPGLLCEMRLNSDDLEVTQFTMRVIDRKTVIIPASSLGRPAGIDGVKQLSSRLLC